MYVNHEFQEEERDIQAERTAEPVQKFNSTSAIIEFFVKRYV
jgi:hypothetical protein